MGGFAGEADAHPCVSFTINLIQAKLGLTQSLLEKQHNVYLNLQETDYGWSKGKWITVHFQQVVQIAQRRQGV
ncbi:V-type proton ATPase subunit C-like [Dorcoceras hygrometricum]|uniref:V-type proton ATPase subunit C-like n=1 Tax=Dorcoceras hygrometricum TaxID=472368 RepID=A0A2Z7A1V0_9LAMI|nr:V-type proton ATPase subunit C-like [Dorcoceras hygrometricum]